MVDAEVGGSASLHVIERRGDGELPPVVIVHGGMDRSSSFGRVARQLGDTWLVRYDRRGYGRSVALGAGDPDQQVQDLVRVMDGRRSAVVGHSVGGLIALLAAERRPDLVGSVLAYEVPTPWQAWWPMPNRSQDLSPEDEAEAFMRRMVGDRIWDRLPARTRADRRREGLALRADLAGLEAAAATFDPSRVTVPVVSASGSATSWWHKRGSEELAAALPRGSYEEIAEGDHGVHLSHPSAFAALILRVRALAVGAGDA